MAEVSEQELERVRTLLHRDWMYSFTPERVRRYHLNRSDYLNEEIRHSQRAIRNALLGYKHASNSRKTCRTDLLDTTWILENLELVGRQLPRESSSQGNPNQESVQELHRQICQLFEDDALAVCERGHNQEVALDLASQVIATHMRTIREFQEEYFKVTGKKHELKKLEDNAYGVLLTPSPKRMPKNFQRRRSDGDDDDDGPGNWGNLNPVAPV